jgi:hypothetical protein
MEIILRDPAAVAAARPAVVVASDTAAASAWLASPLPSGTARSENPTMARHPSCASNATQVIGQLLPGTPGADCGPILDDEAASGAPNPDDGGDCHQDCQSCHDPGQPARICRSVAAWCLSIATRRRSTASLADHWPRGMLSAMAVSHEADRPGAFRDRNDHGPWGRRSPRPVRALHSGAINEPLTTALPPPPALGERGHRRLG